MNEDRKERLKRLVTVLLVILWNFTVIVLILAFAYRVGVLK